ncbi:hypothetical protein M514_01643 [Trichuris suis]|uniref:Uncharacterized protein n=1 Tax=Trichuris suis TaxID=68888 RepID=A0A085N5T8_9BILA|nr:hypothetical protein M513_01643 [Trichuris suis]KFD64834.1 hypothetical protein M514_01643 [Trichuris suis]
MLVSNFFRSQCTKDAQDVNHLVNLNTLRWGFMVFMPLPYIFFKRRDPEFSYSVLGNLVKLS